MYNSSRFRVPIHGAIRCPSYVFQHLALFPLKLACSDKGCKNSVFRGHSDGILSSIQPLARSTQSLKPHLDGAVFFQTVILGKRLEQNNWTRYLCCITGQLQLFCSRGPVSKMNLGGYRSRICANVAFGWICL